MKHSSPIVLSALLLAVTATGAQAATVTLGSITASWLNPLPVASIDGTLGQGTSNPMIAWGGNGVTTIGAVGGDSGYGFAAIASASGTVPPSPSPNFTLGTFTHFNQPITGASITGVNLSIKTDIHVGTIDEGLQTFVFHFTHDETPNGSIGDACPDGGTVGAPGVDVNGCADHVQISSTTSSSNFPVGADFYTLNILGFQQASGLFSDDFWTQEGANDSADLIANVSLSVPEPGSLPLIGASLAALALSRRRRR